VVLDDDGTVLEDVELLRIRVGDFVPDVALRKEELGGPLDIGAPLADLVDLAFPAGPDSGNRTTGFSW
jgi:hypothetical protein